MGLKEPGKTKSPKGSKSNPGGSSSPDADVRTQVGVKLGHTEFHLSDAPMLLDGHPSVGRNVSQTALKAV